MNTAVIVFLLVGIVCAAEKESESITYKGKMGPQTVLLLSQLNAKLNAIGTITVSMAVLVSSFLIPPLSGVPTVIAYRSTRVHDVNYWTREL
ncbi:hypothetical protein OS493_003788 [Desmophyllum pertusum]|uniref:Uncharacterized protein n=1 Tax=Desmophyllum pertusum TaxID=174260 RepID=A0A9X0DBR9_9CNID|nr:hypothetical protein OS493_003788 [Desmophyllum pertusum]